MQFDWWTFAFQTINILVLLWLLNRFLFRPVARIIADRKAETDKLLQEAKAAKQAAVEAEKAAQAEQEQIVADRFSLLETARTEAETENQVIISQAKEQAAEILAQAKQAVAQQKDDDRRQRVRRAAELSVSITGRLLANLPGDSLIAGYPQRLAAAMTALGAEEKAAISAEVDTLHLVAPRALSAAEQASVRDAIGSMIPLDGEIPVEIEPSLIAGLELRSRHGVIHNSLGSDLARMAEALEKEEKKP